MCHRLLLLACILVTLSIHSVRADDKPTNFVLFFADDLGYADLNCFGGDRMTTPNLDQMAAEGMRLTSFYASQGVCSASRCSLLTGCYNVRVGILGALGPGAKVCLNPEETTLPEVLKKARYATAIFGKWHLGDRGAGLPLNHGFDQFHGLPYSNDMWPFHPTSRSYPPLPMYHNNEIINPNVTAEDQNNLTRWATENAVRFVKENKDKPFFLYVPFSMPHVPLFVSEKFKDQTGQGLFRDVISEIDSGVGRVLETLKEEGLDSNTLVWFTSDNGPWLSYGDHAGSAGPLREGKGTAWEGGVREPTVVRWPSRIAPGTSNDEVAGTIDVLPTFAEIAGAALPEKAIDGRSILSLLNGTANATSPHEAYYYYWGKELQAVRSGPWKLHFPHSYRSLKEAGSGGLPGPYVEKKCGLELYNLASDIGEQTDVASDHPDVVQRLEKLAEQMRDELGDSLTSRSGSAIRPAGRLP